MNFKSCFETATKNLKNSDNSENLEQPRRQSTPMGKRKRDSEDEEDSSSSSEDEMPPQILTPIGMLPKEAAKAIRRNELSRRLNKGASGWLCKYCAKGDGKIGGLSSFNMKIIYALEQDNRRALHEGQFIRLIVDKYNELIHQENMMRNSDIPLPRLTYEEYEMHLIKCFDEKNPVSQMWDRVEMIKEQIDFLQHNASTFRNQFGQVVVDNKTNRTIQSKEASLKGYLKEIDNIESREKREREKEKQKLRTQLQRTGKHDFYAG
jgi:hypothetical protein